jgi:hypothetical protein
MKSRITIDIADDNQPAIRIEYNESEDVRDKLIKRFMEAFGSESTFASFYYINRLESNNLAEIRPIGPREARKLSEVFYKETVEKGNI